MKIYIFKLFNISGSVVGAGHRLLLEGHTRQKNMWHPNNREEAQSVLYRQNAETTHVELLKSFFNSFLIEFYKKQLDIIKEHMEIWLKYQFKNKKTLAHPTGNALTLVRHQVMFYLQR